MKYTILETELGNLLLAGNTHGLCHLRLPRGDVPVEPEADWERDDVYLSEACDQLLAYLGGRRRSFSVALAPQGSTFQKEVWAALLRIPYGQTCTYGALAKRLGREGAARAIGAANGANPLPLIIPCHRVVSSRGMGGYSGGASFKRRLLRLENAAFTS
ncbi:methylated-DNA--[protein]-cysteine S-methyltransferase [Halomonas shantousis]